MSEKLGFTFYPKDWWTSDSFFLLQPFERYIYLECLFNMYVNDGWISNNKLIVERRLGTTIKDEVWSKITELMVEDGDQLTHKSVNKRLRKTLANRENGKKGGRPKKPKKPNSETQKNPPLEREGEREGEREYKGKGKDARAFEILKEFKQTDLDTLWMQNKQFIPDKNKLINAFNIQIELELAKDEIELEPDVLLPRFKKYLNSWVNNEVKDIKANEFRNPQPQPQKRNRF